MSIRINTLFTEHQVCQMLAAAALFVSAPVIAQEASPSLESVPSVQRPGAQASLDFIQHRVAAAARSSTAPQTPAVASAVPATVPATGVPGFSSRDAHMMIARGIRPEIKICEGTSDGAHRGTNWSINCQISGLILNPLVR